MTNGWGGVYVSPKRKRVRKNEVTVGVNARQGLKRKFYKVAGHNLLDEEAIGMSPRRLTNWAGHM